MQQGDYDFFKDVKANALLYGAAICLIGGAMYHYPKVFALKAERAEKQAASDEKTKWACAAIEGRNPLLVDEGGNPLSLKDGAKYYGASRLGNDMNPIPAGTILRDMTGAAGIMQQGATGEVTFNFVGSCPAIAATPGVTTMGTYFQVDQK